MSEVRSERAEAGRGARAAACTAARRHVLYPNLYAWYILAATLDIIVTHQILHQFRGWEVNKLAAMLIERFGVAGMIGLKYSSIIVVVAICEVVGRHNQILGRRLAIAAICLSALPVGIGLLQIAAWTHLVPLADTGLGDVEGGGFGVPPPGGVSR